MQFSRTYHVPNLAGLRPVRKLESNIYFLCELLPFMQKQQAARGEKSKQEGCLLPCIWHGLPLRSSCLIPSLQAAVCRYGRSCCQELLWWVPVGLHSLGEWEPGSWGISIPAPHLPCPFHSKTLGSTKRVKRLLYSPYVLIPQSSSVKPSLPHPGTLGYDPNRCPLQWNQLFSSPHSQRCFTSSDISGPTPGLTVLNMTTSAPI